MLDYTGHPLVDVGIATIAAFAGKRDPRTLTEADLDQIADYIERNYVVDPLKSFLSVAFPNSGFTQPAYNTQPEKRQVYADRVLHAYRSNVPTLDVPCVFTGKPAAAIPFDVKGQLKPGRTFRQHVPLLTGEDVINYFPYGDAGLPISGAALLAIQALPLGCAKVRGRLLAVHCNDPDLMYEFALRFLRQNRQKILTAQQAGEKKLLEDPHWPGTTIIYTLLELERERTEAEKEERPISITAYHFSNSGQGVDLKLYHIPLEIAAFLKAAMSSRYRVAWMALCDRGWEVVWGRAARKGEAFAPRYNVLYEDLFRLPEETPQFIRRYFLRIPDRRPSLPGDPTAGYSVRQDVGLVSWDLTALFLRKVVNMNPNRIEQIRKLGDTLAEYVSSENERRFFQSFLMARRYDNLRALLIRASVARIKQGQPPLIAFDPYTEVFEEGEDLPYTDWRLARDLVLIRMIEQLHQLGWLQAHAEEIPESAMEEETTA